MSETNPAMQAPLRPLYRRTPMITPAASPSFSPMKETPTQIIRALESQGVIKIASGTNGQNSFSLNKPLSSLSQTQIDQLNNALGFKITEQNIQLSKDESDLKNRDIITVDNDKLSLSKPLSSLSQSDIAKLNNLGFNITQAQVSESQDLSDLESNGIITHSGDNLQLNASLDKLTPDQVSKLNAVGFKITQEQINQAKTAVSQQSEASDLQSRGIVSVKGDQVTLNQPISSLSSDDISKLNTIGFNITAEQINQAKISDIQQSKINSLQSSGIINVNGNTITLQRDYSLSPDEIKALNDLGINITAQQVQQATSLKTLSSIGIVTVKGNQIVLNYDPSQLSTQEKAMLSDLGFKTSSSKSGQSVTATTKYTPVQIQQQNQVFLQALQSGKITQSEYNEAMVQQNANLTVDQILQQQAINTLASKGIVTTTHNPSTPLQKSFVLNKPLATLSDNDVYILRQAGFDLTPEQNTQRIETQNLISDKVIKMSGNTAQLIKPVTALSDADISRLRDIGINVPSLPKGAEQYAIEYSQGLPTKIAPIISTSTGISTFYAKQQIPQAAAVLGDFLHTLAAPVQLVQDLTSGNVALNGKVSTPLNQPLLNLKQGWRGPTTSTLKYYVDLTPTQQIELSATGVLASAAAGYLEFLPVGFATGGIIKDAASGLTTKILASETGASLVNGLKTIASNLKVAIPDILPIESVSTTKLTGVMTTLMKNPKFQQAIIWGSMAGLNAIDVYHQLANGKPVDDVIEQSAVNIAGQIGSLKGFQSGYNFSNEQVAQMAKLVRFTGADFQITPEGEIITPYSKIKDVPKQLKELYDIELDPVAGKVKVVGFLTKINGETTVQPIIQQFGSDAFNKLLESGKLEITESQLNKLSLSQLFDKVVMGKNLNPDEIKTILVKYIGEDGFRQLEMSALKNGGKELLEMSPKEMKIALYKELGEGSLWTKPLTDLEKTNAFPLTGKAHFEYIAAITDEMKTKIPPEVQTLFNQLKTMGFDDSEASYWASQIMTKSPEQIIGKMENLIDNAYDKQKIAELIQYGSNNTTTVQMLQSAGLNQTQIEGVIQASALSHGDPATFAATLSKIDPKSAMVTMQMISKDEFASSLMYFETKPLVRILETAISNSNTALIGTMMPLISATALTDVLNSTSSESITQVAPYISSSNLSSIMSSSNTKSNTKINLIIGMTPEQLNSVLPSITPKDFSRIFSKLSPEALSRILPNLTPDQLDSIIPNLSPDVVDEILPKLSSDQFSAIMQKLEITPEMQTPYPPGETPPPPPPPLIPPIVTPSSPKLLDDSNNLIQGTTLFEVKLAYSNNSSQTYKVRAKSFHGAANQALLRRSTSQLPTDVKVTIKYELNKASAI